MLNSSDRTTYLDALKPPLGYRIEYVVGTTYSVDLNTILMANLSMCLFEREETSSQNCDPIALLESSRRMSEKLILLHEPGEVIQFTKYHPLFYFIEDSLYPSLSPKGGVFHPKLWFIKYVDGENNGILRFLCSSRNVTFDKSWDFILSLEGRYEDGLNRDFNVSSISKFFKHIQPANLSDSKRELYERAIYDMKRFKFSLPEGVENIDFIPLGVKGAQNPLPEIEAESSCFVSPFLSEKFLEENLKGDKKIVISRNEELKNVSHKLLDQINEKWIINDTLFDFTSGEQGASEREISNELHAKILIFEKKRKAQIFIGSANATNAAFSSNVEFILRIDGKKDKIGIDAFLSDESFSFKGVLSPFDTCAEDEGDNDAKRREWEAILFKAKKFIFSQELFVKYQKKEGFHSMKIVVPEYEDDFISRNNLKIRVCPATIDERYSKPLVSGRTINFTMDSLSNLTKIFKFIVSTSDYEFGSHLFVSKLDGDLFPQERSDLAEFFRIVDQRT